MKVKKIVQEWYQDYKVPSMYICTSVCSFKCEKESEVHCCQNSGLAKQKTVEISDIWIIERYLKNPITEAIVIAGLEPFDQFDEVAEFIVKLRFQYRCNDTVVIYTGYNKAEIAAQIEELKTFRNIIVKFGRFIPNQEKHYDEVLGVDLASPNQYAEVIS